VKERESFLRQAEELTEDPFGGHGCCHREISATQSLGQSEEVRGDSFLLAGKHGAGAAETRRNLIGDKEHAVLVTEGSGRAQESLGLDEHACRALNQWLENKGREFVSVVGESLLQFVYGRVDVKGVEEKGLKDPMEGVYAA
jgi:hypothetical protein